MGLTTDRNDPELGHGIDEEPIPQHKKYLVLSEEERAKGFVRPVRTSYIHKGRKVKREGTFISLEEGLENGSDFVKNYYTQKNGYVGFIKYPESKSPLTGRFIKQADLDEFNSYKEYVGGCGSKTTMGLALAETYARDPKFYGATYCCTCMMHKDVNEFVWNNTDEVVGS